MTHLLKTRVFARLADKYGISDATRKATVEEMRAGHTSANLGGNVYNHLQDLADQLLPLSEDDIALALQKEKLLEIV